MVCSPPREPQWGPQGSWSPGCPLHLVTHDVGSSHVHLVIILLALSGPRHLRLVLNLEGKQESLEWAGAPALRHLAVAA